MIIRSRSEWGAAPPARPYSWIGPNVALTVHWVGNTLGEYAPTRTPEILQGIQRNHIDIQAWSDIAYSFAVDRHGVAWALRGWDVRTAANGTEAGNSGSIAVLYVGGQGDPFTVAARTTIAELRRTHIARGGLIDAWGHQDWTPTACPGDEILRWVRTLSADLEPATVPLEDTMNSTQEAKLDEVRRDIVDGHLAGGIVAQLDVRLNNIVAKLDAIETRLGAIEGGEVPTAEDIVLAAARRIVE